MSELVLFTNAMSRGNTAELLLKMMDVPYKRIELAYGAEMHTKEYLAINPMAKVPALVDGDVIVTECAAICLYLADKFIEKALLQHSIALSVVLITAGFYSPQVRLNLRLPSLI